MQVCRCTAAAVGVLLSLTSQLTIAACGTCEALTGAYRENDMLGEDSAAPPAKFRAFSKTLARATVAIRAGLCIVCSIHGLRIPAPNKVELLFL